MKAKHIHQTRMITLIIVFIIISNVPFDADLQCATWMTGDPHKTASNQKRGMMVDPLLGFKKQWRKSQLPLKQQSAKRLPTYIPSPREVSITGKCRKQNKKGCISLTGSFKSSDPFGAFFFKRKQQYTCQAHVGEQKPFEQKALDCDRCLDKGLLCCNSCFCFCGRPHLAQFRWF